MLVFGASFSNIVSQQDAVHFALTWALVNSHALWLNGTLYAGQPYVAQLGLHTFSALPPGLAFFGLAFVAPAPIILPLEPSVVAAYLATYFSCVVGALATVAFFKIAKLFGSTRSAILLSLVFAFGTSMWAYSRMYLPEGLATLLGIASIYYLLQVRSTVDEGLLATGGEVERRQGIEKYHPWAAGTPEHVAFPAYLSGIFLGLAIFVDNMAVFFVIPIFLYLIFLNRGALLPRVGNTLFSLLGFVAGLILGSIPTGYYDLSTTGSVLTAPYGSPLIGGVEPSAYGISALSFLSGLYRTVFSPQTGLLLFTPFVIVSALGLVYHLAGNGRGRGRGAPAAKLLLSAGLFVSILLPFSLQVPSSYPHNTVGPSELVLAVPFALLPAMTVLDRFKRPTLRGLPVYLLAGTSILVNGIIALTDPVVVFGLNLANGNGFWASPLLETNVPLFLGQSYLTWWSFFAHPLYYAVTVLVFPLVVFLIYLFSPVTIRLRPSRHGRPPSRPMILERYRGEKLS